MREEQPLRSVIIPNRNSQQGGRVLPNSTAAIGQQLVRQINPDRLPSVNLDVGESKNLDESDIQEFLFEDEPKKSLNEKKLTVQSYTQTL